MFDPLPVPTRVLTGESVTSYAQRHAANNFTTPHDVERAAREHGFALSTSPQAEERKVLWRQLGALHANAFTTPVAVHGVRLSERLLCVRCTGGIRASGRLPHVGAVCLRHRRWVGGGDQVDVSGRPDLLEAEKTFAKSLASRGVVFDAPVMILTSEAARAAVAATASDFGELVRLDLVAYPVQVRLAVLLANGALMEPITAPGFDSAERDRVLREAVMAALPDDERVEYWRALTRIGSVVASVARERIDAEIRSVPPRDLHGLLRLWS